MMLITKLFSLSLSSNFSSLKALLSSVTCPPWIPSLSAEQKSLFMFPKILRLFQSLSLLCRRRLSFVTFPRRSFHGFCLSLEIKAERERNEGSMGFLLMHACCFIQALPNSCSEVQETAASPSKNLSHSLLMTTSHYFNDDFL